MQPTSTNRRPNDLSLDEAATSLEQSTTLGDSPVGLDGLARSAQPEPLFTKDSPTLGAGLVTPLRRTRSATRSPMIWVVAVLFLAALVTIAFIARHQHRMGDGTVRGEATPNAAPTPDDKSP